MEHSISDSTQQRIHCTINTVKEIIERVSDEHFTTVLFIYVELISEITHFEFMATSLLVIDKRYIF